MAFSGETRDLDHAMIRKMALEYDGVQSDMYSGFGEET